MSCFTAMIRTVVKQRVKLVGLELQVRFLIQVTVWNGGVGHTGNRYKNFSFVTVANGSCNAVAQT